MYTYINTHIYIIYIYIYIYIYISDIDLISLLADKTMSQTILIY